MARVVCFALTVMVVIVCLELSQFPGSAEGACPGTCPKQACTESIAFSWVGSDGGGKNVAFSDNTCAANWPVPQPVWSCRTQQGGTCNQKQSTNVTVYSASLTFDCTDKPIKYPETDNYGLGMGAMTIAKYKGSGS
jgi:hypothetical protein